MPDIQTRTDSFLSVRDLKVHFPTVDGIVKATDGLSLRPRARQDARHRRRVRLGQVGLELGDPRPAPRHAARMVSGGSCSTAIDLLDAQRRGDAACAAARTSR